MVASSAEHHSDEMNDLHQRAILLWIYAKKRDASANPAEGIFFALTDGVWPSGISLAENTIQLCDVLNEVKGWAPLTEEGKHRLNSQALMLMQQNEKGRTSLNLAKILPWLDRSGYLLGFLSFLLTGFSWWILILMFSVWSCHGAARTAVAFAKKEARPSWEVPALGLLHAIALLGLLSVAIVRMAMS